MSSTDYSYRRLVKVHMNEYLNEYLKEHKSWFSYIFCCSNRTMKKQKNVLVAIVDMIKNLDDKIGQLESKNSKLQYQLDQKQTQIDELEMQIGNNDKELIEYLNVLSSKELKHLCYSLPIIYNKDSMSASGSKENIIDRIMENKYTYYDVICHVNKYKKYKYLIICSGNNNSQHAKKCDKYIKNGKNMAIQYCGDCSVHGYYTNDKKSACFDVKIGDRREIRKKSAILCDLCSMNTSIDEYENPFYHPIEEKEEEDNDDAEN